MKAVADSLYKDHPRVCGEKIAKKSGHAVGLGSPPRVRGKGECCDILHRHERITPACAGKRGVNQCFMTGKRDHPRVCGEKHILSREGRWV